MDLCDSIEEPSGAFGAELQRRCPQCGGPLDFRTPHVVIDRLLIRALCSQECVLRLTSPPSSMTRTRARGPDRGLLLAAAVLLVTMSSFGHAYLLGDAGRPVIARADASGRSVAAPPPEPIYLGPSWPPTDREWQIALASDLWVHPLDGPNRRMPVTDGRVFGAERPGERPAECKNGHCGVDLSGPWGEPIRAVHDGVIDRVQRGANEDHGGHYVRIAHRDGTVITQYFHLAAIPRGIIAGKSIKLGEVIGLLGDTGVRNSGPHLHFTISVKPAAQLVERYIDPEPLIALWPLRVELQGGVGMLTAQAVPGVPRGASSRRPPRRAARASVAPSPSDLLPVGD